ncbi:Uncharacterised protein [Kingella potus]|uniref:Uncharacterized protein n=1 Tax=Kingella potus TaxID=265175 RepID=A0A377R1N2_9NEIS|nr:hypothetical protein [Kingella potus]STQ99861.1 Uncharacterised protein [Kingella potus]STR02406.1 Uncharacterised protein [Kingella potus]
MNAPSLMNLANLASALLIFVHCACRLTVQRWTLRQPELWIHAVLLASAVGVAASSADTANPHEVILNAATAAYFAAQTWRLRNSRARNW